MDKLRWTKQVDCSVSAPSGEADAVATQSVNVSKEALDKWEVTAIESVMKSVNEFADLGDRKINSEIRYPMIEKLYPLHVSYKVGQHVMFRYPHSLWANSHWAQMKITKRWGGYYYDLEPVTSRRYREGQSSSFIDMRPI
jgi:hypothetical protein